MYKSMVAMVSCVFLLGGSTVFASPYGVVMGGDVRITGTGSGLVFPDMSVQTTATGKGAQGEPGPANTLSIGTVTTGAPGSSAAASITGTAPAQTINLVIPQGLQGPAGPASLPSLNLTACTAYDGSPSRIMISVASDGTVSFKCPTAGPKFVFISSKAYNGNLGGLTGADGKCQSLANAAGLNGVYKAWLSDSTGSPASRLTHSPGNYLMVDGSLAAQDWASLAAGAFIYRDETGQVASLVGSGATGPAGTILVGDCAAWANTASNGTAIPPNPVTGSGYSCHDWSDATANYSGGLGPFAQFGGMWSCGSGSCSNLDPIYCVEQ
jgi:hypothetical protein